MFVLASAPATQLQRTWIALQLSAPGAVVSHRSAAQLHRVGRFTNREVDVVEADGREHHTSLIDAEVDRWRDLALAAEGYVVIRVTSRQLRRRQVQPAKARGTTRSIASGTWRRSMRSISPR